MEERLQILGRGRPGQPFGDFADVGRDGDLLARQQLEQRRLVEVAHAALVHDGGDGRSFGEVRVVHQRRAAGADRAHEDLVLFEVGGLDEDAHAVGQLELGHVQRIVVILGDDVHRRQLLGQQFGVRGRVLVRLQLLGRHALQHRGQLGLGGRRHAFLLRRDDEEGAVVVAHQLLRHRIDVIHGDGGQRLLHQRVLHCDAGDRFTRQEMAHVFFGKRDAVGVLPVAVEALVVLQHLRLGPLQFRRGEAVLLHACHFGHDHVDAVEDAVVQQLCAHRVGVHRAHQVAAAHERGGEGRIRLPANLVQAEVEHGVEERLQQVLPVVGCAFGRDGRQLADQLEDRLRVFGIGDDQVAGVVVGGHVKRRARVRVGRLGQIGEAFSDHLLDRVHVEVAHGNHGHEIGPVPRLVVAPHGLRGRSAHDLHVADGLAVGVAGIAEEHRQQLLADAARRVLIAQPPLFHDHAALRIHLFGIDGRVRGPVFQHVKTGGQNLGIVGGHAQLVDRLVEGGVGVEIGTEADAQALQEIHQLLLGKAAGAVEEHVFQEVGETQLVGIFLERAGVDGQAQFGSVLRLGVAFDDVR